MRRLLDETNADLKAVLELLIAEDADITVREVARRHPLLKNASSFTRREDRNELIEEAQQRQAAARSVRLAPVTKRAATTTESLAAKTAELEVLDSQVKALVAGCAACIRAVWKHGGTPGLDRFWVEYKVIASTLRELDAMPSGAQVIELPHRK